MKILAHRGFWETASEKNGLAAIERAFASGYGIETDLRDLDGDLVVSHDPARHGCMHFVSMLDLYDLYGRPGTIAINIKADGLQPALADMLRQRGLDDYFVFDMSVPDSLSYLKAGMRVFTRRSEYEAPSTLDDQAGGIWLDHFGQGFSAVSHVQEARHAGMPVAIVSPELHGRSHLEAWTAWRDAIAAEQELDGGALLLCTDYPDAARAFFATA